MITGNTKVIAVLHTYPARAYFFRFFNSYLHGKRSHYQAQTAIAVVLIGVFAILGKDPVLSLFAWLTNVGALGVIFLMALTSVAVFVYLRRHSDVTEATLSHEAAAVVSSIALFVVFVLALTNFDALVGTTPGDPLNWVLPGLIVAAALIGLVYGLVLKRTRPDVYAMVGRGGDDSA